MIAKGDSSIFFVGPGGRELFQVFFRQNRSGLLTRSITKEGGDFVQDGIKDMKWDFQRKALWVIYGGGDIALYFSDVEYDIMGWVRYSFGGGSCDARSLVRFADRTVGFIRNNGRMYRCPIPYKKGYSHFIDDDGGQIVSYAQFLPLSQGGSLGTGSNFTKRNRDVILKTSGTVRLEFGADRLQRSVTESERREATWQVENYVDENDKGYRIPRLDVRHTANEKFYFASMGYTCEVNEK